MPLPDKFTTRIIVVETKVTNEGRTKSGGSYRLYQVIATKPSGEPIDQFNLRSFQELPTNEVIEVDAELYKSRSGFGDSYTLTRKTTGPSMSQRMKTLEERVEALEQKLAAQSAPSVGPPPVPTSTMPPIPSTDQSPAGGEDIPF